MTNTSIDGLRLSFEYFGAGPGLSGISELAIESTATSVTLTVVPDLTERQPNDATVVELGLDCGWREIVAVVDDQRAYAFFTEGNTEGEFARPWTIGFEGPRNFASELIALAWAGPPLSDIARGLAAARNDQLTAMHNKAGSFLRKPFVRRIVAVTELALESEIPLKDLVSRQRGPALDLSAIRKDAKQLIRAREAEAKATQLKRDWLVEPFREEIELVAQTWWKNYPVHSSNDSMGRSIRHGALKRYLEQFVIEHGAMPIGKHAASAKFGTSELKVKFDMDQLHGPEQANAD